MLTCRMGADIGLHRLGFLLEFRPNSQYRQLLMGNQSNTCAPEVSAAMSLVVSLLSLPLLRYPPVFSYPLH